MDRQEVDVECCRCLSVLAEVHQPCWGCSASVEETIGMGLDALCHLPLLAAFCWILPLSAAGPMAAASRIPQLVLEVQHQKPMEKVRETYTYSSLQTVQDVDGTAVDEDPD